MIYIFDIHRYNLLTSEEDKDLYKYQCNIINNITPENMTESILNVAILLTMSPAEYFDDSIEILYEYFLESNDIKVCIIGSYLASTWQSYKENIFLDSIKYVAKITKDKQQKAILYYLLAYDIKMHDKIYDDKQTYINLLKLSIKSSIKYAYNYYDLAQISDKKTAKKLMDIVLLNVTIFSQEEVKKMIMSDFVSYDAFINEFILGVEITDVVFEGLYRFYLKL